MATAAATRRTIPPRRDERGRPWSREAPTWLLAIAIYGGWALLTWFYAALPWWVVAPLGGWLVAWHGSLQHETIHGHPSRNGAVNTALGFPPLGLWMPYDVYRDTHLAHHCDERLTDPVDDPESFYLTPDAWARLGPVARAILRANNSLIGRLVLGPPLTLGRFWISQARAALRSAELRRVWLIHAAGVAAVLAWVVGVCGVPLWAYLLLFVYPGVSLTLLRSFAEHRAVADPGQRTTVVEAGPLFGLLYLNNNLHVAHHASPGVPWHELPALWREARSRLLAPGPAGPTAARVYRGYGDIAARFLLRPIDSPEHPLSPSPVEPDSAAA